MLKLSRHPWPLVGMILTVFCGWCCQNEEIRSTDHVETAMQSVLDHYASPEDSLKRMSAEFLIDNLRYGFTYTGQQVDTYDAVFDSLRGVTSGETVEVIFERFQLEHGEISVSQLSLVEDHEAMTADYLIENIEDAFEAWQTYPWASGVSFEHFRDFVLPYRVGNERLESWRPYLRERFEWIRDSMKNPEDPLEFFGLANVHTLQDFLVTVDWPYPLAAKHSQILQVNMGTCEEESALLIAVLRAFGIPATRDIVPAWGQRPFGHSWAVVFGEDGRAFWCEDEQDHIPSDSGNVPASQRPLLSGVLPYYRGSIMPFTVKRAPKVYRTYRTASHDQVIQTVQKYPDELFGIFMSSRLEDVTSTYLRDAVDISIDLWDTPRGVHVAYLGVFRIQQRFEPVAIAEIRNGKAAFKDVGQNIVYFPICYKNGEFSPIGDPFVVSNGSMRTFKAGQDREVVILTRKDYLNAVTVNRASQMLGGRIEGANASDFSDAITIHQIDSIPMYLNEVSLQGSDQFRYIRYVAPENSHSEIAELQVWIEDQRLTGQLIGPRGYLGYEIEHIADDDWDSYFRMKEPGNYWVGYDLGQPERVDKIGFCPRNDTNMIRPGHRYQLYYWEDGWHGLGIQEAAEMELVVRDVPEGALLWLHNLMGGNEENVFVYEGGKQVFFH